MTARPRTDPAPQAAAPGFVPAPGPIPDAVLRAVYASDQDMYPVALPYARLRAWADASEDLSVCFRPSSSSPSRSASPLPEKASAGAAPGGCDAPGGEAAGVVIVLPLRRPFWEDLLQGRLKEWEVEPRDMFASPAAATAAAASGAGSGSRDGDLGERRGAEEEVGLHVYHIERFDNNATKNNNAAGSGGQGAVIPRFSEAALAEVMRRARARPGWKVVGMSALTATPAGRRTFERLGFSPTGYRELFVAKSHEQVASEAADKRPLEIVYVYPGEMTEPDEVVGEGFITAASEMTVRYETSIEFDGVDKKHPAP
ncbi:hypothetical protein VTH06DRAFT_1794 [Thermothelomyces fergusii]